MSTIRANAFLDSSGGNTATINGALAVNTSSLRSELNAAGSAPIYACRAWVNFDGTTITIRASGNVTSITDNGVGDYTINFATAMQDENYCMVGLANNVLIEDTATRTASACRVQGAAYGGTASDGVQTNIAIFR